MCFKSQISYKYVQKKLCFRTGFRQIGEQPRALCSADTDANVKYSHVSKDILILVFSQKYKLILNSLYREQNQLHSLLKPHAVRWSRVCNLPF